MEPTGHCPFVGLKQNRAIRFSSPTPEHRCYVDGDPIEIPVDQTSYCLSRNHTQCPLYMGLSVSTTNDSTTIPLPALAPAPSGGLRGWLTSLSPRDRLVYAVMLGMLAAIVIIYLVAGIQSLTGMPNLSVTRTALTAASRTPASVADLATATSAPPEPTSDGIPTSGAGQTAFTPTNLPTSTPSPQPTAEPTNEPVFFPPTSQPTKRPAQTSSVPSTTPVAQATNTTLAPTATTQPVQLSPTARPAQPSPTARPPLPSPTAQPVQPSPTARPPQPSPTAPATAVPVVPTGVPPTTVPPTAVPPTAVPPTSTPRPVETRTEILWLYFGDTTGTLFVPVQRRVTVENRDSARAALRELIAGPREGLTPLVLPDVQILDLRIENGTAIVNLDREPTGPGDTRGIDAITLTLTHFSSIARVQIQVNGQPLGPPAPRPVVNPINPHGLPVDITQTEFLPLYFVANDGYHHIRVIRMVPKTKQTAEGTVRALLEGPGDYAYALQRTIPEGTELRGIHLDNGVVSVDFTQPLADAGDRTAVVRTVVESLTTLPGVKGVRFLIEGASIGDWWGSEYARIFERPLINAE